MQSDPASRKPAVRGALFGLLAAALFGLSAPVAKMLLGSVPPVLLAGLLYAGAAAALSGKRLLDAGSRESGLRRSDVPLLLGVIISGGIAGPVLMLLGLERVSAMTGSLLLNLEGPFTAGLAVLLFGEHLGPTGIVATLMIMAGAAVLKLEPGALGADSIGILLLAAACACWALDNNLTQRLSLRDPFAVVRLKTLVAGVINSALGALIHRGPWPSPGTIAAALLLGAVSYGASVVLDAYALRMVGAAREAAYFATAPFVGALASMALRGEVAERADVLAMAAMACGVVLLLRERHAHMHEHAPLEHEHLHQHDEHHRHAHVATDPLGEPHSHLHRHAPLVHDHPHVPDAHHRHRH